jgi:hypothetical protein
MAILQYIVSILNDKTNTFEYSCDRYRSVAQRELGGDGEELVLSRRSKVTGEHMAKPARKTYYHRS